ncbi:MAG: UDP-2,4-diacetamido-2,4,6-trideoxy-beta-L-altropyranose hydrolase [Prosthecobacter sp.]|uniref:UDP-2,4-diacetamido-2,4, 6-trideoxy-beta-L-altropyranose hydrolase n=1 Tax=Prosthecobacter sp. TaxID=1965333 RepID=UPI003901D19E
MPASALFGTLGIRADASPQIGMGHVMRCIALAQAWIDRGGKVILFTDEIPPALKQRLEAEKIEIRASADLNGDVIVLDGYHFTPGHRLAFQQAGRPLLIVDDLADTDLSAADLVLNHNAYATAAMYPGQRSLCGSRFTLLRREFAARPVRTQFAGTARTVLITMGGSDPRNDTLAVLQQLAACTDLHLRVLIGAANPHVESLRAVPGIEMLIQPPDLPEIMQQADVAITAAGSTCWELASLGVPMLLKVIAENQQGIADHLVSHAAGRWFDLGALHEVLADAGQRQALAQNAHNLVDGRGAGRVAENMACYPLSLRRATLDDARLLLEWANDPVTRQASFNSEPIVWETHVAWLQRRLNDAQCAFYIAEAGTQAVGTVRFDRREGGVAEISLSLAPSARGRGLGAKLIRLGTVTVLDEGLCQQVSGWVKADNRASISAFQRAGHTAHASALQHGAAALEFRSQV